MSSRARRPPEPIRGSPRMVVDLVAEQLEGAPARRLGREPSLRLSGPNGCAMCHGLLPDADSRAGLTVNRARAWPFRTQDSMAARRADRTAACSGRSSPSMLSAPVAVNAVAAEPRCATARIAATRSALSRMRSARVGTESGSLWRALLGELFFEC